MTNLSEMTETLDNESNWSDEISFWRIYDEHN